MLPPASRRPTSDEPHTCATNRQSNQLEHCIAPFLSIETPDSRRGEDDNNSLADGFVRASNLAGYFASRSGAWSHEQSLIGCKFVRPVDRFIRTCTHEPTSGGLKTEPRGRMTGLSPLFCERTSTQDGCLGVRAANFISETIIPIRTEASATPVHKSNARTRCP